MLCYLDLETLCPPRERRLPIVVDHKVKTTPLAQFKADHDFQPAVYLSGRWLEGDPAAGFSFAQIAKPGPRRKEMGATIVTTTRSVGQLRGALVRIAQVARQIVANYERFGTDDPWGSPSRAGGSAALATAKRGTSALEGRGCELRHSASVRTVRSIGDPTRRRKAQCDRF